jgi:uncharacterized membrane protein
MKTYIIGFFVTILTILVLDGIWLATMMKSFYVKNLGHIFADKPSLTPALIFYIIYAIGLLYFVVFPLLTAQASYGKIFLTGAFLGLIAYATYDLTNQATVKNWPVIVTLVDLTWGAFLTGTVAAVTAWVIRIYKLY